jgi:hypothetical protein
MLVLKGGASVKFAERASRGSQTTKNNSEPGMNFHRENAGLHSFTVVETQAIGTPKVISCQLGF